MFNWFKKKKKEIEEEIKLEEQKETASEELSSDEEIKENEKNLEIKDFEQKAEKNISDEENSFFQEKPDVKYEENFEEKNQKAESQEKLFEDDIKKVIENNGDFIEKTDLEEESESAGEVFEEPKKQGLFKSLFSGLNKTRKKMGDQLDNLLNNYSEIDEDLYEEIEDVLITADVGMDITMELIENLRKELVKRKVKDPLKVKEVLRDVMVDYLSVDKNMDLTQNTPSVILVIGVNGAGKTTSIGKIAHRLKSEGKKVVLAAADTFRAAAIDQLKVWAERADVGFVAHSEGSDPSAVIFDGIKSAQAKKADILICDTAGRLHNKVNLMNELNKMFRIIEREYPEASKEVLLVLDATTGQNALNQAEQFLESAGITGLVVTKLDGTAKGGFVFAIRSKLGIPVKLIGIGEKIEDLQKFNAKDFANAILNLSDAEI